jgi:hypothetical protein
MQTCVSSSGGGGASSGAVEPGYPWPDCPFSDGIADVDPQSPYPFCQPDASSAYELFCARQDASHGYMNWHADGNGTTSSYCEEWVDCNACMCSIECRNHPDYFVACPEPPSGDAVATCWSWNQPTDTGACLLDCGNGETCPSGMECVDNLEAGMRVCAWLTHGDRCERP